MTLWVAGWYTEFRANRQRDYGKEVFLTVEPKKNDILLFGWIYKFSWLTYVGILME